VLRNVRRAIPLQPAHKDRLLTQLAAVIRATVKGNVLVALVQGTLGGLAFWFSASMRPCSGAW
jgi:predicted PurR-regulated permease PerM